LDRIRRDWHLTFTHRCIATRRLPWSAWNVYGFAKTGRGAMYHRRTAWGLLLVALGGGSAASAQYVNPPARDFVTEDDAVIELGLPAGSRLRSDPSSS